jgi:glycosyltransferase involved in cell wall biosynthesis
MKKEKKPVKVLFFANFPAKDIRSIGGATSLSKRVYDFVIQDDSVAVKHVQIRHFWRSKFQLIDYVAWLFRFPFVAYKYDVISMHVTREFHVSAAPFLYLWAKILGKKVVYHTFGGGFYRQYKALPKALRWLLSKTIVQADVLALETKDLVDSFKNDGQKNTIWVPNSVKATKHFRKNRPFEKKIVFISRLDPDKGIPEVIEAANLLPEGYQIDAYGPIDPKHYDKNPFEGSKVNYKGILHHDDIIKTIDDNNLLLMPTYIDREGYPTVIIEALSVGVPVITTDCCVMKEMITDKYNGLIIEPRSGKALADAILHFNDDNYSEYQKNAYESFKIFNSDIVFQKFIDAYHNA